ncbi:hypothetical protein QYF36_012137 [Acer negundo]|nr:hypothetical protein QYF36_012137 [Acer negundo]
MGNLILNHVDNQWRVLPGGMGENIQEENSGWRVDDFSSNMNVEDIGKADGGGGAGVTYGPPTLDNVVDGYVAYALNIVVDVATEKRLSREVAHARHARGFDTNMHGKVNTDIGCNQPIHVFGSGKVCENDKGGGNRDMNGCGYQVDNEFGGNVEVIKKKGKWKRWAREGRR